MVITGGEPLMYHADKTFYEVVSWLVKEGIQITFETNGTVEIDFDLYSPLTDLVSLHSL